MSIDTQSKGGLQAIDPQLVQTIVKKVIQALGQGDALNVDPPAGDSPHGDQGPEVYILETRDRADEAGLRALLPPDSRLVFLADCNCPIARGREYDRILLPCLEMGLLADLALGRASDPMARGILTLLMGGRTIEVVSHGHEGYAATAPPALMALYRGYARTVAGFGLVPLDGGAGSAATPLERIPRTPRSGDGGIQAQGAPVPGRTLPLVPLATAKAGRAGDKVPRLITEAHVAAATTRGETRLVLPRRTLVTALAQDLALEQGIEICRADG